MLTKRLRPAEHPLPDPDLSSRNRHERGSRERTHVILVRDHSGEIRQPPTIAHARRPPCLWPCSTSDSSGFRSFGPAKAPLSRRGTEKFLAVPRPQNASGSPHRGNPKGQKGSRGPEAIAQQARRGLGRRAEGLRRLREPLL